MRFVDLKSEEQLDIQSLHRVRSRFVAQRSTLINQILAILLERGLIFAAGRRKLEVALDRLPGDQEANLRIPMKPATDFNIKPARHSDFIPAGVPI